MLSLPENLHFIIIIILIKVAGKILPGNSGFFNCFKEFFFFFFFKFFGFVNCWSFKFGSTTETEFGA